ncbi:Mitochondrial outer membrane protein porin [Melia azedarach]|uniref:Mitochondrial outer membrane protein porin n=1 Tax=Melia azedarach TaxID=155640 RepID=A0ACC1XLH7_MELAZ|nr:Mitochondrial outer membrane protein porin [Melia azedarach]
MSQSPGLFIDIGRKARDLLYKDYGQQPPLHFHYQYIDSSFDLSCKCGDIVPGLSTVFRFIIPDSGRVELRYLSDYAGISASVGLKANHNRSIGLDPTVKFSGVIGSSLFSLGTDVAIDVSTRTFKNYNTGLSFNAVFLNASLTLNDKLDSLKASYYQELNPLTRTAVAAELKHTFSHNSSLSDDNVITTTFTGGVQHALFPSTLVKARINTDGMVGALVQQSFWERFSVSIAGEVDFRAKSWIPKMGFSMALRS